MPLQEYRRKRRFSETPEPAGERPRAKTPTKHTQRFVVQKHAASRLHYDFRLEIDGVLKSWAIPKGPCLDPAEKRLAAHVEDHPIEYRDFEGIIPQGEYGGGTVVVWDAGTWESDHDLAEQYRRGRMKFRLQGKKLQGGWNLVRMRARKPGADDWLLIKERDEAARPLSDFDVLQKKPKSVLTGRTLEQIAREADRVWHSNRGEAKPAITSGARGGKAGRTAPKRRLAAGRLHGAKRAKIPARIALELPTSRAHPMDGPGWLNEIHFDGIRTLCRIEKGTARLSAMKERVWTDRFPELAADLAALPAKSAWLDGVIVALGPDGMSDLAALRDSLREGRTGQLTYCVFDLLYLDGYELRSAALADRKRLLADVLAGHAAGRVQYVEHIEGSGDEFYEQCCHMGLEGILCRRSDRPYRAGRSADWIKVKCRRAKDRPVKVRKTAP